MLALQLHHSREIAERAGDVGGIAEIPPDGDAALEEQGRMGQIAMIASSDRQGIQSDGNAAVVVQREAGFETLFEELARSGVVALFGSQDGSGEQQAGAQVGARGRTFQGQQAGNRVAALAEMFASLPEGKERGSEAQRPFGVSGLDQVIEGGAEVIVFHVETPEPLWVHNDLVSPLFGEHEVISGVGAAGGGFVGALGKAFEGVFADSGETEEAGFGIGLLDLLGQTFIDHGGHAVEHIEAKIAPGIAHGLDAFEGAAAGEDGQPAE